MTFSFFLRLFWVAGFFSLFSPHFLRAQEADPSLLPRLAEPPAYHLIDPPPSQSDLLCPGRAGETHNRIIDLEPYKPTYFIAGRPDVKIQISFKFKLIESTPFYLAYSQLMMWKLFDSNPRFTDLNYTPDFFYRVHIGGDENYGQWLDLGLFEHESNGMGIPRERTWNRSYLRYQDFVRLGETSRFYWSFKVWYPYGYKHFNPDILNYRGLYELTITWANVLGRLYDHSDLTLRVWSGGWKGLNLSRGGQELTLQVKAKERRLLPLVVFQLFHGYGESLLTADIKQYNFRIGIGI